MFVNLIDDESKQLGKLTLIFKEGSSNFFFLRDRLQFTYYLQSKLLKYIQNHEELMNGKGIVNKFILIIEESV